MRRPSLAIPRWLRATLPFALTALISIAVTLALVPRPQPAPLTPAPTTVIILLPTDTPAPTATATEVIPAPPPTPEPATPTIAVLPSDTISLRIIELEQDLSYTRGSILLLQAASRLQAARLALRDNQPTEVTRQLAVAQEELNAALQLVPESVKGPIQELYGDINVLRDDLAVRPEAADARLASLWETTIVLVGAAMP